VLRVAGIKVYVRDDVEEKFRRLAMSVYSYGKGSISKAAVEAFLLRIMRQGSKLGEFNIPEDPVAAIKGLLSSVGKSGVELSSKLGVDTS
jgi:hypothetical protein